MGGHYTRFSTLSSPSRREQYVLVDSLCALEHSRPGKGGTLAEFNRILEKQVIPLLHRQKGFRDELVLTNPNGTEEVGISIWEQKENAEAYNRDKFPEIQQLLAKVLEGTPQFKTYEVSHSTVHKIASHATREDDHLPFNIPFKRCCFDGGGLASPHPIFISNEAGRRFSFAAKEIETPERGVFLFGKTLYGRRVSLLRTLEGCENFPPRVFKN